MKILRVEGENRIDIESVVALLAKDYGVTDKIALKWLCTAIKYNLVIAAVKDQIDFLLDEGVISRGEE